MRNIKADLTTQKLHDAIDGLNLAIFSRKEDLRRAEDEIIVAQARGIEPDAVIDMMEAMANMIREDIARFIDVREALEV